MNQPAMKPSVATIKTRTLHGFTLIEVMVALAIIAIALAAVSRSLGITVSNQSHLESRVVATWLAENAIVEQQLFGKTQSENKRSESMLNRDWSVEFATEPTFIPEIYKLSVKVSEKGSDAVVANLFSVVGPE
ncbi:hypothetical protein THMIRHAM_21100 [Thiomicrorhabdus immobilis]|uniref:Type II secretion system protein I n=1 Tax=Thiomicrorhabdus immobilis TaxID=2791037 RepID=A0ABN6CZ92_9GAMM|nr:type II secretion system minor pseudopilin GspI [Thiomicrorhabdus immobilis]BCN94325.1 hypothetical protein THMIRHAM_21100 [Thiomicrorhabdus immobilis]